MTDFELLGEGGFQVDAYGPTAFQVGNRQYTGPLLMYHGVVLSWRVTTWKDITPDALSPLLLFKERPELLVLGSGSRLHRAPSALTQSLRESGILVEVCDTANAVSTFNVLLQEGRRVAGAFLTAGQE